MAFDSLKERTRHNLSTLKASPLAELSGALGDLGTLLPLMIGLALSGSISLSTTLVFSGVFNILTGVVFGVPIPVQPMKAIAASAIASSVHTSETVAAGSLVGLAVLILGVTGLLNHAMRIIPVPVIKGIQLGAGLSLTITAGRLIQSLGWIHPSVLDNRVWALAFFIILLATQSLPRFPYALVLFLLGILFAMLTIVVPSIDDDMGLGGGNKGHANHGNRLPGPHLWHPHLLLPSYTPTAIGMAVSQLPLTLLNSIIAVSALSSDLLPSIPAPSPAALSFSVGGMNILGCWFGSMPVCHGSGGLAAQYRFGARSGASIILLGLLKLFVGLVFGDSLLDLLGEFPRGMLGVMVLAAGLELAGVGESLNSSTPALGVEDGDMNRGGGGGGAGGVLDRVMKLDEKERKRRWAVMLLTAAGSVGFRNAGVGFVAGMLCHWSYKAADWIVGRRAMGLGSRERAPLLGGD
ncbi:hypothetical protein MKZ38_005172 [Zalerion maritima]|uniref:Sulfate transporter n=1 Tax=Zalerion maritima TaxID=339359 RepID=A0AAD5RW60_9PEZI|nr:hypothetical protein MKZ38_005172 [Zalerion maritima]